MLIKFTILSSFLWWGSSIKIYIDNETMVKIPFGASNTVTCENEDLEISMNFSGLLGKFQIKNIKEKDITEIVIKIVGFFNREIECVAKSKNGKEFHLTNNQSSTNAINNRQFINRWL